MRALKQYIPNKEKENISSFFLKNVQEKTVKFLMSPLSYCFRWEISSVMDVKIEMQPVLLGML